MSMHAWQVITPKDGGIDQDTYTSDTFNAFHELTDTRHTFFKSLVFSLRAYRLRPPWSWQKSGKHLQPWQPTLWLVRRCGLGREPYSPGNWSSSPPKDLHDQPPCVLIGQLTIRMFGMS